jgi:hypothetical protein
VRTPNTSCLLCAKPLYRRPFEMAKTRYAACMECRSEAQKVAGITAAQHLALGLARKKGFNYRDGHKDSPETKAKRSATLKQVHADNPLIAIERGKKTRGANNYNWKGGASKLNVSIRQMHENRKWMDAVKARDGACVRCGSKDRLESHHKVDLADLLVRYGIKDRDGARACDALWDLSNGETLCEQCHYAEHGRTGAPSRRARVVPVLLNCANCGVGFAARPSRQQRCCGSTCAKVYRRTNPKRGADNPSWKGGLASVDCERCGTLFFTKRAKLTTARFCSRECVGNAR